MASSNRAGRKPLPQEVKELAGTARPDRVNAEAPVVEIFSKAPGCPTHLKGIARAMWQRTAAELAGMGVLTQVDLRGLETYCSLYARWRKAEKELEDGLTTLSGKDGQTLTASPYVKIALDCSIQMRAWMNEFGMTPSSRSRVKVEKKAPEPTPGGIDWFGDANRN